MTNVYQPVNNQEINNYNDLLQRQAEEMARKTATLEKKHELERKSGYKILFKRE